MWDLDTLRWLNERASLSAQKMVNEGVNSPEPATKPQSVYPLAVLAAKLIVGPPSIIRIIDLLENSESVAQFLELIREFLPDREHEIMASIEDSDRIQIFCRYFSDQYFPLEDNYMTGMGEGLSDFLYIIPVPLMGFSIEDYEEFMGFRDGFLPLLAMVSNPYENYADNERVPILEQLKVLVGKELTALIPDDGWSPEDIHTMFDESPYPGVIAFADWIHQQTGKMQLDTNYSEYGPCSWGPDLVHDLTDEWPRVMELQGVMNDMYSWLEEDMRQNFAKLMAVMHGRERINEVYVAKEQMPFPLDENGQVVKKEVTSGGKHSG